MTRLSPCTTLLTGLGLMLAHASASAYPLMEKDGTTVNLDVEVILGHFSSSETYGNSASSPSWTEGYAKVGFSGEHALTNGTLFGAANVLASGTWGDGDAAGLTTGDERETDIEDLYLGFRTPVFSLSVGRQNISLGDGFIINGDALNLGEGLDGIAPGFSADRGGAYWLAARKAYANTALLSIGQEAGLRSDVFWLQSDNPAQSSVEMAGINFEHVSDVGTVGLLYLSGLDVDDDEAAVLGHDGRDGQKTWSLRFQGNVGHENLFLSAEYVNQEPGNNNSDTNAWYAEAGWTFANAPWSPSVNVRYTQYDTGYDPLFFGFSRGYGTWFQGEVAANYAGPFGTDSAVQYLGITASPRETLTVGASYFGFVDTVDDSGDNDATEINVWAEWVAHDHLIISPLVGLYTPDAATSTQGNDDTNTYVQVLAIVPF